MKKTRIKWADSTWNPITGCSPISEGCANCYAERMSKRLAGRFGYPADEPFRVTLHPERLDEPKHWRKPKRVFVCSMGDLFHTDVPFEFIALVFGRMHSARHHTYLVLTKRPDRMAEFIRWYQQEWLGPFASAWPREYQHVWLGVTAENQRTADERIPLLLAIPAAKRFVSCEPLLGPVDLAGLNGLIGVGLSTIDALNGYHIHHDDDDKAERYDRLDWVIAGGETGPGARPMHPDWARSLRDQCQAAGVPFFFKHFGEWGITKPHTYLHSGLEGQLVSCTCTDSTNQKSVGTVSYYAFPQEYKEGPGQLEVMSKMGKQRAGRLLDGREWNERPEVGL